MGTPLGVTGGGGVAGLVAFFDFFFAGFFPFSTFPDPSDSALPGPAGGVAVEVVRVVVGVFEVLVVGFDVVGVVELPVGFCFGFGCGVVEVEVEVVCGWVLVVTVAAGVVAVTGGHDCTTLVIGRLTGRGRDVGGVPGATFSNVNCWPPATVIVTVQPSAEAFGMAARPITVTRHATVTAAIVSFRLLNTVAYSSRRAPRTNSSQLRSQIGLKGRYWLPRSFAIRNRWCGGCLSRD